MQLILNNYTSEDQTQYAFLTYNDIKGLRKISKEENDTFLIIKAPKGTIMEVPTFDDLNQQ